MKRYIILAALGLFLLLPTFASGAIQYAGAPGGTAYWEDGGSVGSEFISNITADVIRLGIWDYNGDGLAGSHIVSLWDASGNLIVSATVGAGTVDPLIGGYRWVEVTAPIVAGQHYSILAKYYGNGVNDYIQTGASIDPAFTFVKDLDTQGTSSYGGPYIPDPVPGNAEYTMVSDWNGASGTPTAWFGPNLQAIPEPATIIIWSLLGGASWFGVRVWRQRRIAVPARRQPWSDESRMAIHQMIERGRH